MLGYQGIPRNIKGVNCDLSTLGGSNNIIAITGFTEAITANTKVELIFKALNPDSGNFGYILTTYYDNTAPSNEKFIGQVDAPMSGLNEF